MRTCKQPLTLNQLRKQERNQIWLDTFWIFVGHGLLLLLCCWSAVLIGLENVLILGTLLTVELLFVSHTNQLSIYHDYTRDNFDAKEVRWSLRYYGIFVYSNYDYITFVSMKFCDLDD